MKIRKTIYTIVLSLMSLSTVTFFNVSYALTFDEACALPTTVNCWGFESENDMRYTWPQSGACAADNFLNTHVNGRHGFGLARQDLGNAIANNIGSRCSYPKIVSDFSSSGSSSLRFTLLSESSAKVGGDFTPVFKRLGNIAGQYKFARFGPGGEFWVRFSMRQTPEMLATIFRRADTQNGNNGGIKRLIVHGNESSSSLEETIVDGWHRRIPTMYSNSGTEDYGIQANIGCTRQEPDIESNYSEPPCKKFKSNVWRTYQMYVKVADNAQRNNGIVELYLDDEATPVIRVTNADMSGATGAPYAEDTVWSSGDGYGKMSFTFYATNKDWTQVHPEGYVWYDDVVISHTRVPVITGSSSSNGLLAPSKATGVKVQKN